MAFNVYTAYLNAIAKEPVDDWRELNQEMINDTWLDTSTVATVQGQTTVGGITFANESVQISSVINPSTGENFGDEFRKIVYKNYTTTDKWLGKYYKFDNITWLITNTDTKIGALNTAILRKCNNWLKWIDPNGVLNSWECVFKRSITNTNLNEGSEGVPQINADTLIQVQKNSKTTAIPYNQRFIFDGHAFQIKQINNHISDTYMELYLFEAQVQPNDDLVNNIADGSGEISPTTNENKILPEIVKILQSETQLFTVYKYINGVPNTNTFAVSASGPVAGTNYTLTTVDGNNFSIANILQSNLPLVITCTNNITSEVVNMNIMLGGKW